MELTRSEAKHTSRSTADIRYIAFEARQISLKRTTRFGEHGRAPMTYMGAKADLTGSARLQNVGSREIELELCRSHTFE